VGCRGLAASFAGAPRLGGEPPIARRRFRAPRRSGHRGLARNPARPPCGGGPRLTVSLLASPPLPLPPHPPQVKEQLAQQLATLSGELDSLRGAADTATASAAARDGGARRLMKPEHAAAIEASAARQAAMQAQMEALAAQLADAKAQNDELVRKLAEAGRKLRMADKGTEAARASMARQAAARRKDKNQAWLANKRIRVRAQLVRGPGV
jgi:hypothetical protein